MIVGVTGTRHEPPQEQLVMLRVQLIRLHRGGILLAHGKCLGWDEMACQLAREIGYRTRAHPPMDRRFMADTVDDYVAEPQSYPARNAAIVDESAVLIAGPAYPEEHSRSRRSGTWMTVRMARTKGIPIRIIHPDGAIEGEGQWPR